jgi:hypothetical protein
MVIQWLQKNDCEIVRTDGCAWLVNVKEGSQILTVPDSFSDTQIWECLRVAKIAYGHGYRHGRKAKVDEIKDALCL